jgi:hypothetical protein
VLSCVGRGLVAGLIPRPRSPTKCLKGSINKKKNPTPEKGIRDNEKEEEEELRVSLMTLTDGNVVNGSDLAVELVITTKIWPCETNDFSFDRYGNFWNTRDTNFHQIKCIYIYTY